MPASWTFQIIDSVTPPPGQSVAWCASKDGTQIYGGWQPPGQTAQQPFRWTAATGCVSIAVPLGPIAANGGCVFDCSDDGTSLVGQLTDASGNAYPARWDGSGSAVAYLDTGTHSAVNCISGDGTRAGGYQATPLNPCYWIGTGPAASLPLPAAGPLGSYATVEITGINRNGTQFCGIVGYLSGAQQGYHWPNVVVPPTPMGFLPGNVQNLSSAWSMSDDGSVIGGGSNDYTNSNDAALWYPATGTWSALPTDPENDYLQLVWKVSADGNTALLGAPGGVQAIWTLIGGTVALNYYSGGSAQGLSRDGARPVGGGSGTNALYFKPIAPPPPAGPGLPYPIPILPPFSMQCLPVRRVCLDPASYAARWAKHFPG